MAGSVREKSGFSHVENKQLIQPLYDTARTILTKTAVRQVWQTFIRHYLCLCSALGKPR